MVLGIVYVSSQPFGVVSVLSLFFWIPESVRNIWNILRNSFNWMNWLGNRINRFIKFYFSKHQLGYSASFVSVIPRSESELYTLCFLGFLNM